MAASDTEKPQQLNVMMFEAQLLKCVPYCRESYLSLCKAIHQRLTREFKCDRAELSSLLPTIYFVPQPSNDKPTIAERSLLIRLIEHIRHVWSSVELCEQLPTQRQGAPIFYYSFQSRSDYKEDCVNVSTAETDEVETTADGGELRIPLLPLSSVHHVPAPRRESKIDFGAKNSYLDVIYAIIFALPIPLYLKPDILYEWYKFVKSSQLLKLLYRGLPASFVNEFQRQCGLDYSSAASLALLDQLTEVVYPRKLLRINLPLLQQTPRSNHSIDSHLFRSTRHLVAGPPRTNKTEAVLNYVCQLNSDKVAMVIWLDAQPNLWQAYQKVACELLGEDITKLDAQVLIAHVNQHLMTRPEINDLLIIFDHVNFYEEIADLISGLESPKIRVLAISCNDQFNPAFTQVRVTASCLFSRNDNQQNKAESIQLAWSVWETHLEMIQKNTPSPAVFEKLMILFQQMDKVPELLLLAVANSDQVLLDEILKPLRQSSFIVAEPSKIKTLRLHPAVQKFIEDYCQRTRGDALPNSLLDSPWALTAIISTLNHATCQTGVFLDNFPEMPIDIAIWKQNDVLVSMLAPLFAQQDADTLAGLNKLALGMAYFYLGLVARYSRHFKIEQKYIALALTISKRHFNSDSFDLAKIRLYALETMITSGQYAEALDIIDQITPVFNDHDDTLKLILAYKYKADVLRKLHQDEAALKFLKQALEHLNQLQNHAVTAIQRPLACLRGMICTSLGFVYHNQRRLQAALVAFRKASNQLKPYYHLDHPYILANTEGFAMLAIINPHNTNRLHVSIALLQRSLGSKKNLYGDSHPRLLNTLLDLIYAGSFNKHKYSYECLIDSCAWLFSIFFPNDHPNMVRLISLQLNIQKPSAEKRLALLYKCAYLQMKCFCRGETDHIRELRGIVHMLGRTCSLSRSLVLINHVMALAVRHCSADVNLELRCRYSRASIYFNHDQFWQATRDVDQIITACTGVDEAQVRLNMQCRELKEKMCSDLLATGIFKLRKPSASVVANNPWQKVQTVMHHVFTEGLLHEQLTRLRQVLTTAITELRLSLPSVFILYASDKACQETDETWVGTFAQNLGNDLLRLGFEVSIDIGDNWANAPAGYAAGCCQRAEKTLLLTTHSLLLDYEGLASPTLVSCLKALEDKQTCIVPWLMMGNSEATLAALGLAERLAAGFESNGEEGYLNTLLDVICYLVDESLRAPLQVTFTDAQAVVDEQIVCLLEVCDKDAVKACDLGQSAV